MITKEQEIEKYKKAIKKIHVQKNLNDGKNAHRNAIAKKIEAQRKKGLERRTFRAKIAKENGVRVQRVVLTGTLIKGKATYIIK